MPVPAAAIVVAAVVGSAAEVGMSVVVVAAAQERQLTGKGDRQQLERAARARSSAAFSCSIAEDSTLSLYVCKGANLPKLDKNFNRLLLSLETGWQKE